MSGQNRSSTVVLNIFSHLQSVLLRMASPFRSLTPAQPAFAQPHPPVPPSIPSSPFCSMASPFPSLSAFAAHLSHEVDIVFPVIHGKFGEDGGIQALLEQHSIPFVGTSAAAADFLALNSQPSHPLSLPGTVGAA
ncbi:unnamed protein product [Closterium sp. NIES-53]